MPIDIEKDSVETALKKLKARENALRRLEAVAKLGSWEVDLKTNKSYWSDRSYEIYGYKPGEIEPSLNTFFSHLLPDYIESSRQVLKEMTQTKKVKSHLVKSRRKDGKIIDLLLNAEMIFDEDGKPSKLIGTTQDITEYVELQRQADELFQIIEKSSNEIYILDIKTLRYLYVNEGGLKKLGYTKEELFSMDVYAINPYLTQERAKEIKKELLRNGEFVVRTVHRCKNGEEYPAQSYLQTIWYQNKEALIIFDTDITEQIKVEKKEREQAKIVESINDGVVVTDLDGNIQNYNNSFIRIVGTQKFDNITLLLGEENKYTLKRLLQKSVKITSNESDAVEMELLFNRSDGKEIVCELSLTQLQDEDGKPYAIVWMFQDITHKKFSSCYWKNRRKNWNFMHIMTH